MSCTVSSDVRCVNKADCLEKGCALARKDAQLKRAASILEGIGDINSTAKGSGARFNDGKPDLSIVPLRIVAHTVKSLQLRKAMLWLAQWQEGGNENTLLECMRLLDEGSLNWRTGAWSECLAVFKYGQQKYAAWNWAKGMPWSVPLACAARHILDMDDSQLLDEESQLPHRGHLMCNLVMLIQYFSTYPEGDDRPKELRVP